MGISSPTSKKITIMQWFPYYDSHRKFIVNTTFIVKLGTWCWTEWHKVFDFDFCNFTAFVKTYLSYGHGSERENKKWETSISMQIFRFAPKLPMEFLLDDKQEEKMDLQVRSGKFYQGGYSNPMFLLFIAELCSPPYCAIFTKKEIQ